MRPSRSFFLLLIFLVCFTGFHYILPSSNLFPPLKEYLNEEITATFIPAKATSHNVGSAKQDQDFPDDTAYSAVRRILSDSISTDTIIPAADPLEIFMDSLSDRGRQTRIIYYGDSQIEGDRITSKLRQSLREVSGGTGPGLFLPLMPVMYTKTVWIRSSANWARYNYLSYSNNEISHRKFGPFMAICRYLPEGVTSESPEKAFVKVKPSKPADSLSSVYDRLRIFYRNIEGTVSFRVLGDDKLIIEDTLARTGRVSEFICRLNDPEEVTVEFTGRTSPDIYGISIESQTGVIVDNMPQRGSAGLEFTMVDEKNLSESWTLLHPDLIILQYGLNIVRNVRSDYSYYVTGLARQLSLIRQISGDVPVIVVGLTDMATGKGDSLRSYPNIPAILGAQKKASDETGALFWDSWHSMGGESSIIRWSKKNPPLAQKDLVHLTYEGADTLAALLADSLFFRQKQESETTVSQVELTAPVPHEKTESVPQESGKAKVLAGSIFRYDPQNPMIFTTAAFWLFFLIVIAGYSLIYKRLFLRNFYLFLISLFFYYESGGLFLFLLIFVTTIDFLSGLIIGNSKKKFVRKLFIILSIVSNIGILAYFKYTGFLIGTLNDLLGTDFRVYDFLADFSNAHLGTTFGISSIILPVGISFFTFQSLSYTIDVYRRKIDPVRNIIDFGFFVSFFPQLVAGPIVRASEFIPQLYVPFHLEKREFSHALFLISKGLIKKIIISDFIAVNFVDRVFDAPSMYSGFENLMAVYGYGLQIYCDFSGYTDIAIGLGLILGFRLPFNFNSPYKASGVSDFWKRWHISLSRWLKDYLYIPLGGNRKGKLRTYVNLLVTMILGGLWHGASLRFIIWGFLHGVGLVADRLIRRVFGEHSQRGFMKFLAVFLTFQFVSFCWIFFRAPDMESVRIILSQITGNFRPGTWSVVILSYSSVFLLIAAGYLVHFLPESIKESYRGLFIRVPVAVQMAVVMIIAVMLFQMRSSDTMPFIYFRF
ncbi:MAG TPA: MBOAT family O-acyltransferase [Bacteroidales bacterium]|nr:MBOAT family O-acyltransferase [Bacteroidales bacterium]